MSVAARQGSTAAPGPHCRYEDDGKCLVDFTIPVLRSMLQGILKNATSHYLHDADSEPISLMDEVSGGQTLYPHRCEQNHGPQLVCWRELKRRIIKCEQLTKGSERGDQASLRDTPIQMQANPSDQSSGALGWKKVPDGW